MDKEILIFGRIKCTACEAAKRDLTAEDIPYSYIDCDKSQDTAIRHNILSVPTIKVMRGAKTLHAEVGWNKRIMDRLLRMYRE